MRSSRREFLQYAAVAGSAPFAYGLSQPSVVSALDSPIAIFPKLEEILRREADRTPSLLAGRTSLELHAGRGALASGLDRLEVRRGRGPTETIPPDGLLTFAIDVEEAVYVAGRLELEPPDDTRPGLRAYVLSDSTLVAAPMVRAPEWHVDRITDPAPPVEGARPDRLVPIAAWLMPKGRHYLTVAGPHFRTAGRFVRLMLEPLDTSVETPLYQFALIGDTHVRFFGRHEWMNLKLCDASPGEFAATLRGLADEGLSFAMHGGDMTEYAMREEFAMFAGVLKSQPLPVYGCMGNHDVYLPSSRQDARELLVDHFPDGNLDYTFTRPPLRFVVMDVAIEELAARDEKQGWLRQALAADRKTPTIFLWHYAPFNRGGVSDCGFRMHDWSALGREALLPILQQAPNLFATLNGHDHWDEVNVLDGVTHVQNAAFVEWPNSYRVFRVYPDRLEWEVRQVGNRGFIRESFLAPKALSWMIVTRDSDLTGEVRFPRAAMSQTGGRLA